MDHRGDVENRAPEVRAPWKLLRRGGSTKVAFSIRELVGLTSEFSIRHAPNCTSKVIRTDAAKYLLVYRVTCKESYSDPGGHVVRMKFDFKRMKESGSVDDLDVRVSCSCPAWLWWGQQWNVSTGDALYGAPRPMLKAPTDPERYKNIICKHVKVVADRIQPVLDRMLEKHRSEADAAAEKEKKKQLDLVKQQTDLDVQEQKKQPVTPKAPDDLDAMPQDLTELGLPPKAEKPKRGPITPKNLIPDETRKLLKLPPVGTPEPEVGPKAQRLPENIKLVDEDTDTMVLPGGRKRPFPPSVSMVDDEDDSTVVLPGTKRRPMEAENIPAEDAVEERGRKAPRTRGPVEDPRPSLPPNLKLIDDDSDDQVTKINRLLKAKRAALMASLRLAGVEAG